MVISRLRGATMTNCRLAIVGLAAGMPLAATPALAGNGHATPSGCLDQLGPKYLGGACSRTRPITAANRPLPTNKLCEEELGPKYLLGHCVRPAVT